MKIGKYWEYIPGFGDSATCRLCNVQESLEHIMTKCPATGQERVWQLAGEILEKRSMQLGEVKIGDVLGCSLAGYKDRAGKPHKPKKQAIQDYNIRVHVSDMATKM